MPQFEEASPPSPGRRTAELGWRCVDGPLRASFPGVEEANWRACVIGLRDYVNKNGFPGVVLGLSGGIDSAVVATMAVDALGKERVHCVMLPYRYTSNESLNDAAAIAETLGVRYDIVPIEAPVEGFDAALKPVFDGREPDITEENLQSRARGTILMAISNKFGPMVLTTGNKSEMSVGYATLYGDMNGGFNPVKDLYKTEVYALARWRNEHQPKGALGPAGRVIPGEHHHPSADRPNSARTRPTRIRCRPTTSSTTSSSAWSRARCASPRSSRAATTKRPCGRSRRLLYLAEYKRRQAAPGVKITRKNFGRDRRYPITNKFRDRG